MSGGYQPYQETKRSGSAWLGTIPSSLLRKSTRRLARPFRSWRRRQNLQYTRYSGVSAPTQERKMLPDPPRRLSQQAARHWGLVQSQRLFSHRKERMRPDDEQLTASQKYGVIPQKEFMRLEDQKVMQVFAGAEILKHVEPDDFVISMRSFQGGLEWCGHRGCVSSAFRVRWHHADQVGPPPVLSRRVQEQPVHTGPPEHVQSGT